MTNLLLGIGPINSAVRLVRGVVGAVTGGTRSGASFAAVQREAIARRQQETLPIHPAAPAPGGMAETAVNHRTGAARSVEHAMRARAEGLMKKLDTDGNQLLAAAELGVSTAEFQQIDANGDGDVDVQELTRAMQAGRIPAWKA